MKHAQDPFGLNSATKESQVVVILERVDDVAQDDTEYCVHGRTRCLRCNSWCWLGNESYESVKSGRASPVCIRCARESNGIGPHNLIGRLQDNHREDGFHD